MLSISLIYWFLVKNFFIYFYLYTFIYWINGTYLSICLFVWFKCDFVSLRVNYTPPGKETSWRRRNYVSLYVPARRKYVSKETPDDVSVERRQVVSGVPLHDVLLECRDDVLRGRNNDFPSVRFHDISNKSQMKHPTKSQWYVTKTFQCYVSTMSHYYVSTTSPVSPKWNTQQRCCGTSPPRLGVTLLRRSLRLQVTLSWAQSDRFRGLIKSVSNQIPHFSSTNQEENNKSSLD